MLELPTVERDGLTGAILEAEHRGLECEGIKCSLTEEHLWSDFNNITNEMIVTKLGRRMFPVVKVDFSNLTPQAIYRIVIKFTQLDNHRWKFVSGDWCKGGKAEPPPPVPIYEHTESPNFGHHWMKEPVSFTRLKVTNKPNSQGHITLNSLHRYEISVIVLKVDKNTNTTPISITKFPQCNFIAVTAYQNDTLTGMKIRHNPFAKAFLDTSSRGHGHDHHSNHGNLRPHDHHSSSLVQPATFDSPHSWYVDEIGNFRNLIPSSMDGQRLPILGGRGIRSYGLSQESQNIDNNHTHHYQAQTQGSYDQMVPDWLQSQRQGMSQTTHLQQSFLWNNYSNPMMSYVTSSVEDRNECYQDNYYIPSPSQSITPQLPCQQTTIDDKYSKELDYTKHSTCSSPDNFHSFLPKQHHSANTFPFENSFSSPSQSSNQHESSGTTSSLFPPETNDLFDRSPANASPLSSTSSHSLLYPTQSTTPQISNYTIPLPQLSDVGRNESAEYIPSQSVNKVESSCYGQIKGEFQDYYLNQSKQCHGDGQVFYAQSLHHQNWKITEKN